MVLVAALNKQAQSRLGVLEMVLDSEDNFWVQRVVFDSESVVGKRCGFMMQDGGKGPGPY